MGDGYIHFWDVKNGELLLLYSAKYFQNQAMLLTCTDAANRYLFVSDDQGIVFIYDVQRLPPIEEANHANQVRRGTVPSRARGWEGVGALRAHRGRTY